jgi:hypothetical protein
MSSSKYSLKVEKDVLSALAVADVDVDEALDFFASQIESMLRVPPNYQLYGHKLPIWIMRGFFPGTSVFFKMSMVRHDTPINYTDAPRYVKVSIPITKSRKMKPSFVMVDSETLRERLELIVENKFFNAHHELNPIIKEKIRKPKCMSPKGCTLHKFKKKRVKK